jgi:hypothetical protein
MTDLELCLAGLIQIKDLDGVISAEQIEAARRPLLGRVQNQIRQQRRNRQPHTGWRSR